jgi:hypothetical protein
MAWGDRRQGTHGPRFVFAGCQALPKAAVLLPLSTAGEFEPQRKEQVLSLLRASGAVVRPLNRSARWQRSALVLATALSGASVCPALALTPTGAELRIDPVVGGTGKQETVYLAVQDSDLGTIPLTQTRSLTFKVQFGDGSTLIDDGTHPNTTFLTNPVGGDFLVVNQKPVIVLLGYSTPSPLAVTAQYTDPETGNSVSDTVQFQLRSYPAPSFYPAGQTQARLLRQVGGFTEWTTRKLAAGKVSPSLSFAILRDLSIVNRGVEQWWQRKVLAIDSLGTRIVNELLPTKPALALAILERLSNLADELAQAGLLQLSPLPNGGAALVFFTAPPAWWPREFHPGLAIPAPVTTVSWYGLGR